MPRINSIEQRQLTVLAPDQAKERVVARLGSLPDVSYSTSSSEDTDEGSDLSITITAPNVRDGTVLRWRILDRPEDFAVNSGLVTVNSNSGTVIVSPIADLVTEGQKTFRVQIEKITGTVVAISNAVTINDTSAATLTVTPRSLSVNEGDTVTVDVTVDSEDIPDGFQLYWTSSRPTDLVTSSGSFVINDSLGSFTITILEDFLTEGTETLIINVHSGSILGPVIASSPPITVNDTSVPTYSVIPSANNVNEGQSLVFSVTTQGVLTGTVLYWSLSNTSDFAVSSGSFTITNNTGSFSVTPTLDATTEGPETFTASVRIGSISGTVVATSISVTINDTSLNPTYLITSSSNNVNEGSALIFSVSTTDVFNGTTLYWTVSRPEDFAISSGSFVVNSNSGSFTVTPRADATTEGSETFTASVRINSTSGTIVATSQSVTINDTSLTPTYAVTPAASSVNEGSSLTFTVATTNVSNGTTLYWTATNSGDFGIFGWRGSFVINNDSGSFTVTPSADELTEGSETFTVSIRTDSISGSVVATSSSVTINDTSIGIAPSNTSLPVISGTARIDQTLTVSNGTWTGAPTPAFTYQWQRGTTNISGATSSSYIIQSADGNNTLRCVVTGTNATGSASATSASTDTVPIPPSLVSNPTISGTARVGQTLTSSTGTWNGIPTPTFTYQWQRGLSRSSISGATNSSYVVQQADAGGLLRCRVTATNIGGSAEAFTDSVTPESLPVNVSVPTISGDPLIGETLTSSTGTWSGSPFPTFTYQWQRGTSNISGATGSSYTITSSDFNNTIRCRVTGTNTVGSVQAFSANTAAVAVPPTGQSFTEPGTYTWIAPANVTRVSAVAVGGGGAGGAAYWAGGGGGGGGLGWKNNISVVPGASYTVVVGAGGVGTTANDGGNGGNGGVSYFINTSTVRGDGGLGGQGTSSNNNLVYIGGNGGGFAGDGGGFGGTGGNSSGDTPGGGGGAGGYGGNGGGANNDGLGGGGAGGASVGSNSFNGSAGSGGGVGIGGQGDSGNSFNTGGSGGTNGSASFTAGGAANTGGFYGGGGGGQSNDSKNSPGCNGASGAVRIIWGGSPALTYPGGQGVISVVPPAVLVFNYASDADQFFTVPSGVTSLRMKLWGAGGGSNRDAGAGGGGGYTNTVIAVTPGETLTVRVGRGGDGGGQGTSLSTSVQNASTRLIGGDGGWPGGGKGGNTGSYGASGGGGGYSAVFRSGTLLAAAGGGGGGGDDVSGGAGGGTTGLGPSGNGGTQSAGGSSAFTVGTPSGFLQGASYDGSLTGGGGGGGGYYGGGGGGTWSGGGGGSGFFTGTGSTSEGSGIIPAGTGDTDWAAFAGYGAAAGGTGESSSSTFIGLRGYPGRVVFRWG